LFTVNHVSSEVIVFVARPPVSITKKMQRIDYDFTKIDAIRKLLYTVG